jgi:hypothetical protein
VTDLLRLRLCFVHDALAGGTLTVGRAWTIAEGERIDVGLFARAAIRVPLVTRAQLGGRRSYVIENLGGGCLELLHAGHIGTALVAGAVLSSETGRALAAAGDEIVLLTVAGERGLVFAIEAFRG